MKVTYFIAVLTLTFNQFNYSQNLITKQESAMYGLHNKLTATPGNREQLLSILLKASDVVKTAQGCKLYLVSTDINDEDSVWITEVWDSKTDHDNSLQLEEVKALIAQAVPILAKDQSGGQVLQVQGGI